MILCRVLPPRRVFPTVAVLRRSPFQSGLAGGNPIVLPTGTVVQSFGLSVVALTPGGSVLWNTSVSTYYYFSTCHGVDWSWVVG